MWLLFVFLGFGLVGLVALALWNMFWRTARDATIMAAAVAMEVKRNDKLSTGEVLLYVVIGLLAIAGCFWWTCLR